METDDVRWSLIVYTHIQQIFHIADMMLFHKCLRLADLCDILKSQSAVPKIGSSNAKLISRSEKSVGK